MEALIEDEECDDIMEMEGGEEEVSLRYLVPLTLESNKSSINVVIRDGAVSEIDLEEKGRVSVYRLQTKAKWSATEMMAIVDKSPEKQVPTSVIWKEEDRFSIYFNANAPEEDRWELKPHNSWVRHTRTNEKNTSPVIRTREPTLMLQIPNSSFHADPLVISIPDVPKEKSSFLSSIRRREEPCLIMRKVDDGSIMHRLRPNIKIPLEKIAEASTRA